MQTMTVCVCLCPVRVCVYCLCQVGICAELSLLHQHQRIQRQRLPETRLGNDIKEIYHAVKMRMSCKERRCRDEYLPVRSEDDAFLLLGLRGRARAENSSVVTCQQLNSRNLNSIAYLMASSKTLLRLRCVRAEHSMYLTALISLATLIACSYWMGAIFFCLRLSLVPSSSRRSSLVPTRMMGTPGAWCSISGCHCLLCQTMSCS